MQALGAVSERRGLRVVEVNVIESFTTRWGLP